MKWLTTIILGCICMLYSTTIVSAQERSIIPIVTDAMLQEQMGAIRPLTYKVEVELDEVTLGRLEIARIKQQLYGSKQMPNKREMRRDEAIQRKLWKAAIGNTAVTNWSPHPDRMIDARTLSFPMRGIPHR